MPIQISPNPKIVKVFLNNDGTVSPGGAEENLGNNANRAIPDNRGESPKKKGGASQAQQKICLTCSSPAVEGFEHCSFCLVEINKKNA